MTVPPPILTRKNLQFMTGHETEDGIRMALKRAKIRSSSLVFGTGAWPPSKVYEPTVVWTRFANRILPRAAEDEEVRDMCWEIFGDQIRAATAGAPESSLGQLFADKLEQD